MDSGLGIAEDLVFPSRTVCDRLIPLTYDEKNIQYDDLLFWIANPRFYHLSSSFADKANIVRHFVHKKFAGTVKSLIIFVNEELFKLKSLSCNKIIFDAKITQPTLMHNDQILNFDYREHDIGVARTKSRYHQETRLKGHTVEFAASWDYSESVVRDFR